MKIKNKTEETELFSSSYLLYKIVPIIQTVHIILYAFGHKTPDRRELSNKMCEIADAPASLKSDMWNHFSFLVSEIEKGKNLTERQKTIRRDWPTITLHVQSSTVV